MLTGGRVATIVVNYQYVADTIRCVDSLQRSDFLDQRLIVVDNGAEETDTLRAGLDPAVEFIDAGANLGFAGGCNLGIEVAMKRGADFVWLVNPDAVVRPDTLTGLIQVAEDHSDAGIVGAKILHGDSNPPRIWFNGGTIDPVELAPGHPGRGTVDTEQPGRPAFDVDYVTGACMLIRRPVIRQLGPLPEEYFLYFEETDYCVRSRAAGWRAMVAPEVRMWHFKRSSGVLPTGYHLYYMARNRIHFFGRFFDAKPAAVIEKLDKWVGGWRGQVSKHAPDLVESFERVIELAIEDGAAGRMGRRAEIGEALQIGSDESFGSGR